MTYRYTRRELAAQFRRICGYNPVPGAPGMFESCWESSRSNNPAWKCRKHR